MGPTVHNVLMASTLKAAVRNGRLILDVATDLPEGTVVELVKASGEEFPAISAEERAKLNASIDRGLEQAHDGNVISAQDFLKSL